jgi:hypothetical protein
MSEKEKVSTKRITYWLGPLGPIPFLHNGMGTQKPDILNISYRYSNAKI